MKPVGRSSTIGVTAGVAGADLLNLRAVDPTSVPAMSAALALGEIDFFLVEIWTGLSSPGIGRAAGAEKRNNEIDYPSSTKF